MDSFGCQGTTATFNVPVGGHQAGHVFSYHGALEALFELQAYPFHVQKLTLGPIPNYELQHVQDTLYTFQSPLSSLEELSITVRYPHAPNSEEVRELELPQEMFPALRTLRLNGVNMDWESGIFPQLSHVVLLNCPASNITQLVEFIGILPTWTELTELHLGNFLYNPTFDCTDLDSLETGGYYMRPAKLRTLIVDNYIHQIPPLLYHLDVPGPGARVHITGDTESRAVDDERSPFEAMMPFDNNFPSIFTTATSVNLTINETQATLVGVSHIGTMTLDVPHLRRDSRDARARAFRSALLALVSIFAARSAPVQFLTLTGDTSLVSADDWVSVFQDVCPWLRELTVRDIGTGVRSRELFDALAQPYVRNQDKPVCPELQSVVYSGCVDASPDFVGGVYSAFQERSIRKSHAPLRSLTLLLLTQNMAAYTPSQITSWMQLFKQWVYEGVGIQAVPLKFSRTGMVVGEFARY